MTGPITARLSPTAWPPQVDIVVDNEIVASAHVVDASLLIIAIEQVLATVGGWNSGGSANGRWPHQLHRRGES